MRIVVGTSAGVFRDSGKLASGLGEQVTRQLVQFDGTLFAAAGDGVYRSRDAGTSWSRAGVDAGEVWTVGVSPHASGTLYAGTQPAHLFVSQDTGETWREVDQFLQTPGADNGACRTARLGREPWRSPSTHSTHTPLGGRRSRWRGCQ